YQSPLPRKKRRPSPGLCATGAPRLNPQPEPGTRARNIPPRQKPQADREASAGKPARNSVRRARGEILLAVAHGCAALHFHAQMAEASAWRDRIWIVAQQVLRAQLAVDEVEHGVELFNSVQNEKRATGAVGNSDQSVLPGRVAPAFAFDRADDD